MRAGISIHQYTSTMNLAGSRGPFLPEEMNVLAPFVLEALESEDPKARTAALGLVCMFNDPRILFFVNGHEAKGSFPDPVGRMTRSCVGKTREESARNFPLEECTAAFQSQVGDRRVRATFSAAVLPQLSPSQTDLAGERCRPPYL